MNTGKPYGLDNSIWSLKYKVDLKYIKSCSITVIQWLQYTGGISLLEFSLTTVNCSSLNKRMNDNNSGSHTFHSPLLRPVIQLDSYTKTKSTAAEI